MPLLQILKQDGRRQNIELKPGVTMIGRRPDCDIRIPMMLVSRRHCRIVMSDKDAVIEDLGSSNGTYVNSEKIMQSVLEGGDRLSVGPITFMFKPDEMSDSVASGTHAAASGLQGSGLGLSQDADTMSASAVDALDGDQPLAGS